MYWKRSASTLRLSVPCSPIPVEGYWAWRTASVRCPPHYPTVCTTTCYISDVSTIFHNASFLQLTSKRCIAERGCTSGAKNKTLHKTGGAPHRLKLHPLYASFLRTTREADIASGPILCSAMHQRCKEDAERGGDTPKVVHLLLPSSMVTCTFGASHHRRWKKMEEEDAKNAEKNWALFLCTFSEWGACFSFHFSKAKRRYPFSPEVYAS